MNHLKCQINTSNLIRMLLSTYMPYYIFGYKDSDIFISETYISHNFKDINLDNKDIVSAVCTFNYNIALEKMDAAYNAIKYFNISNIWKNLFKLSLKNRKIELAEICVRNMKQIQTAKILKINNKKSKLYKLAILAIQQNLIDDAINLFNEEEDIKDIIELYMNTQEFEKAIKLSESKDRILLKNIYFRIARYNEQINNYDQAIIYYEKSENIEDICRMLLSNNLITKFEEYFINSKNVIIGKNLGYYYKNNNNINKALEIYELIKDYEKTVELYLEIGNISKAEMICDSTKCPAACLLLSEYYDLEDKKIESYKLLLKGNLNNKAINIIETENDDDKLYSIAIQSPFYVQEKYALYFLNKKAYGRAIDLYIKAKNYKLAYNLSIKYNLNEYIQKVTYLIPDYLKGNNKSEELLKQGDYENAFNLMIKEGNYENAVDILKSKKINLMDETVEAIIKYFETKESGVKSKYLRILCKYLKNNGKAQKAHQIYLLLGEHIKSFKCLLKTNNIDSIIKFASFSRNNEIYILTGNYLQSLDFIKNDNLLKNITMFYTKAKDFNSLINFYMNCSLIEVQDYNNIDNANNYLNKIIEIIDKGVTIEAKFNHDYINNEIYNITRYKEAMENNDIDLLNELISSNSKLLTNGKLYYAITISYMNKNEYNSAFQSILDMKNNNLNINNYFNKDFILEICEKSGNNIEILLDNIDNNISEEDIDEDLEDPFS